MTLSSKKLESWGLENETAGSQFGFLQRVTPPPPRPTPGETQVPTTPSTTAPEPPSAAPATPGPDQFAATTPTRPTATHSLLETTTSAFIDATPRALAHPQQGPALIQPIINTWLRHLSQGHYADGSSEAQALAATAGIPETSATTYNNYLLFLPRVARYIQSLEAYRRNPSIQNQRAIVDTFLRIPISLESHRGHPLTLLAQYLEQRSQNIPDQRISQIVRMQGLFLRCADASLSHIHELTSGGPLARRHEAFLRDRITTLRDAVRATTPDGAISDPLVRSFLEGIAHMASRNYFAQGILAAPMALLSLGPDVTGDFLRGSSVTVTDHDGTTHSFLVNAGETPTTFRPVTDISQTPLNGQNVSYNCFEAALCRANDTSCGNPQWNPAEVIAQQYRPVRVDQGERAQPGDVVVYFAPSMWTPDTYGSSRTPPLYIPIRRDITADIFGIDLQPMHMSLVTEVDATGRPTRAIGKMGINRPIMTHDVNHVYGIYGPLIGIYRRRD